ncbi:cryptochrome/photolyase family protein [Fuscibacter oryzae]|uniref:Deoxyribodipyrimidine photo-lyase n=1 Tax=Fuscibacter oryzae TaxID=2803939 RepID=A0A8J7SSB2_9RHOB|nr:deoxyribodipyrimidine photo-lyase [Fuscibacter oryzae]MBL4927590.1 deoxyribodipyrimidine photo-lyase [Fuscibacter oryzae]
MAEPLILWFRRDLRLGDNPVLAAALATGRPVVPVFVLDPETEALGAAAKQRLQMALAAFAAALQGVGSRLILRRGPALEVLERLVEETGAAGVMWSRAYDATSRVRDQVVKAALKARGLLAESHAGFVLHEPWTVETGQGGPYRVFTPYWRAVRALPVAPELPAPVHLPGPERWPDSAALADWNMTCDMQRGAVVLARWQSSGEGAALDRLAGFAEDRMAAYAARRDFVAEDATSGLSEHLTYGEISPRTLWHRGRRAMEEGNPGAETFLKELVWREFAWHLMYHYPELGQDNWKADWNAFPWRGDNADAEKWRRGLTGEPLVDAAMREMFVTGRMHNRARMIAASYLTKHLLTDWRVGLDWFAECLTDWDPAANAMGWQWVAGSGPDASPYFRIFNPATQAEKFDPEGRYRRRWIAEMTRNPGAEALSYFDAVPKSWGMDPAAPYPMPLIDLAAGRERALEALKQGKS